MKGGIAASVIAAEAILAEGVHFDGAIEISGTVDEESGGYAGVSPISRIRASSRSQGSIM